MQQARVSEGFGRDKDTCICLQSGTASSRFGEAQFGMSMNSELACSCNLPFVLFFAVEPFCTLLALPRASLEMVFWVLAATRPHFPLPLRWYGHGGLNLSAVAALNGPAPMIIRCIVDILAAAILVTARQRHTPRLRTHPFDLELATVFCPLQ